MQNRIKFVRYKHKPDTVFVLENLRAGPCKLGRIIRIKDNEWALQDMHGEFIFRDVTLSKVIATAREIFEDDDSTHNHEVKGRYGFTSDGRLFGNVFHQYGTA